MECCLKSLLWSEEYGHIQLKKVSNRYYLGFGLVPSEYTEIPEDYYQAYITEYKVIFLEM